MQERVSPLLDKRRISIIKYIYKINRSIFRFLQRDTTWYDIEQQSRKVAISLVTCLYDIYFNQITENKMLPAARICLEICASSNGEKFVFFLAIRTDVLYTIER